MKKRTATILLVDGYHEGTVYKLDHVWWFRAYDDEIEGDDLLKTPPGVFSTKAKCKAAARAWAKKNGYEVGWV